jgi:hypothetical protein
MVGFFASLHIQATLIVVCFILAQQRTACAIERIPDEHKYIWKSGASGSDPSIFRLREFGTCHQVQAERKTADIQISTISSVNEKSCSNNHLVGSKSILLAVALASSISRHVPNRNQSRTSWTSPLDAASSAIDSKKFGVWKLKQHAPETRSKIALPVYRPRTPPAPRTGDTEGTNLSPHVPKTSASASVEPVGDRKWTTVQGGLTPPGATDAAPPGPPSVLPAIQRSHSPPPPRLSRPVASPERPQHIRRRRPSPSGRARSPSSDPRPRPAERDRPRCPEDRPRTHPVPAVARPARDHRGPGAGGGLDPGPARGLGSPRTAAAAAAASGWDSLLGPAAAARLAAGEDSDEAFPGLLFPAPLVGGATHHRAQGSQSLCGAMDSDRALRGPSPALGDVTPRRLGDSAS